MRFTTLTFLLFFVVFYLSFWSVTGRQRLRLIVLASLIFYAAWSIPFAFHFLAIVLINYLLINQLHRRRNFRTLLPILLLDFGNLFFFKYFYLFLDIIQNLVVQAFQTMGSDPERIESLSEILSRTNFDATLSDIFGASEITLPLAISFYTFQLTAYAIDVYRGEIEERSSLLDFLVFILFFPQLVAGPIMRRSDFYHQLKNIQPSVEKTYSGIFLLTLGVFKKTIIADNVAPVITAIFAEPEIYDRESNIAGMIGFAVQVFCDFSGYTDIARGLSHLLGLNLPENFRAPYLSRSLRELWQRWHITLSSWIRDYLYIPLGGSRQTEMRNFTTVFISFSLAGLWHGANYTFLIWGALHGLLLGLERIARIHYRRVLAQDESGSSALSKITALFQSRSSLVVAKKIFQVTVVFFIWLVVSIPFNSPSLTEATSMLVKIFGAESGGQRHPQSELILWTMVLTFLLNWLQLKESWPQLSNRRALILGVGAVFILVALLGSFSPQGSDFIYFQF